MIKLRDESNLKIFWFLYFLIFVHFYYYIFKTLTLFIEALFERYVFQKKKNKKKYL